MIDVTGLTKRYGSTTAVAGLTFEVRPGRVTGFLGPNGAGKSTTMRMILGLDAPTSGQALVNGRRCSAMSRSLRQVGALLDANAVHGGRSARDHLHCVAQSNGIGRSRVGDVLDIVGLTSVARSRVKTFSLGMKQRLGIATALLGDPQTLMFDEPVNGLDPEGVHWIRGFLRSLASEGRTVFVSSHLMSEMAMTADHLVVVGRGRLISDSSTSDFISRSSRGVVCVRSHRDAELADLLDGAGGSVVREPGGGLAVSGLEPGNVGQVAAEHGIALIELSSRAPSLEDAYLELTADSVDFRAQR